MLTVLFLTYQGEIEITAGVGASVTIVIETPIGGASCLVVARGLWIAVDIEKNTRLDSEATLHLLKVLERKAESVDSGW